MIKSVRRSRTNALRYFIFTSCASAVVLSVGVAHAQQSAAPQDSAVSLQDIVVTAQKRSQNVQDTPLSVTAISGDSLEAAGIVSVQDLSRIDPALQIGRSTGSLQTFIRGIGNPVSTAGNEASVPVYIDDVYYVRASAPFFNLVNIDRVEVLKGPQGTLFGRNASGGVVSVYTVDPGDKFVLRAKLGYGNYQTMSGQFYIAGPISDTISADFSYSGLNQGKGWGKNIATGEDVYRERFDSLRSKIIWRPTATTSIKLIGYYQKSYNEKGLYGRPIPGTAAGTPDGNHTGSARPPEWPTTVATGPVTVGERDVNSSTGLFVLPDGTAVPAGTVLPAGTILPSAVQPALAFYDNNTSFVSFDRSEGYGGSVRIDQETSFADLVSITAFRRNKEFNPSDGDLSLYNSLRYDLNILDRQFSQEFQLKSKSSSSINWILGAYYLNALQGFDPTNIFGTGYALQGISNIAIVGRQRAKSYAGFGQVTVPVTDSTNLTAGLRYTVDKIGGVGTTVISFLPVLGLGDLQAQNDSFNRTFKKWTYKAAVDHHFNDDIMAYASYSRGYKSGTHNTLPLNAPALNPEIVDAYEVGLKTELFDSRLRVNTALFWNDISDPQVQANQNGLVALVNAGAARAKGAEVSFDAAVAQGLTARVGGTYLDAKYRDFQGCPTFIYSQVSPGNLSQVFTNCDGNRLPYASKWKISGSISYAREVAGAGNFIFDVAMNYYSRFNWDSDNVIKEKANTLIDSSISFQPEAAEHLSLRFWMKNITGRKYNTNYFGQVAGYSSSPAAPRTYGGEIIFEF